MIEVTTETQTNVIITMPSQTAMRLSKAIRRAADEIANNDPDDFTDVLSMKQLAEKLIDLI